MNPTLHVVFRHLEASEALTELIEQEVARLAATHPSLSACRVVIEPDGDASRAQAKECRVRLEVSSRGRRFVALRTPAHDGHDDAYLAVREAFRTAERQLDHAHERNVARRRAGARPQPA